MRLFLDTNVFVASLTDEPGRGEFATRLLDRTDEYELHTSLLNLMELRTVLTKKKETDLVAANDAIDEIIYDAEMLDHVGQSPQDVLEELNDDSSSAK